MTLTWVNRTYSFLLQPDMASPIPWSVSMTSVCRWHEAILAAIGPVASACPCMDGPVNSLKNAPA